LGTNLLIIFSSYYVRYYYLFSFLFLSSTSTLFCSVISTATSRLPFDRIVSYCTIPYCTIRYLGGKIFARSLPLLRAKLAPYLKVPGVSVRTARTGAMQDIKNNSLPGIAPITSCGSGERMNDVLNTVHTTPNSSFFFFVLFFIFCFLSSLFYFVLSSKDILSIIMVIYYDLSPLICPLPNLFSSVLFCTREH
jgi:hypothetical protein